MVLAVVIDGGAAELQAPFQVWSALRALTPAYQPKRIFDMGNGVAISDLWYSEMRLHPRLHHRKFGDKGVEDALDS